MTSRLAQSLRRLQTRSLQARLPQWHLQGGVVVADHGKAEVGLRVTLPPSALVGQAGRAAMVVQLKEILRNVIPEGERLRMVQWARPAEAGVLEPYRRGLTSSDPISQAVTEARAGYYREQIGRGRLVQREVYLSLTFGQKRPKQTAFSPGELEALQTQGYLLRERVAAHLRRCGWQADGLDDGGVYGLMEAYFNPDLQGVEPAAYHTSWQSYPDALNLKVPELRPPTLKAHLGRSSVVNASPSTLRVGEHHLKILSLYMQPDSLPPHSGELLSRALLGEGAAWLVLDFLHLSQEATLQSFRTRSRMAASLTAKAAANQEYVDEGVESGAENLKGFLRYLNDMGDRIYAVGAGLILADRDRERLEERVRSALSDLTEVPGRPFRVIGEGLFDTWRALAPYSTLPHDERVILTESNCAHLLPKLGPYRGGEAAQTIFANRHRELTQLELFDPRAQNANYAIVGESGVGKSYLAQRLLLDELRRADTDVFTLDKKDTYRPLCALFGAAGAYIEFSLSGEQGINPLELEAGQLEPDQAQLGFVLRVLRRMVRPHPDPTLAETEKALLEQALRNTYRRKRVQHKAEGRYVERLETPLLRDLDDSLQALRNSPKLDEAERGLAHGLSTRLQFWLRDGVGGRLLDRPTEVGLAGKRVVGVDLGGIAEDENLMGVAMMVIAHHVWRKAKDKTRRTLIHIDEAWALLGDPLGYAMVEEMQRLARSHNAAVGLVVHETKDLNRPGIDSNIASFFLMAFEDKENFISLRLGLPDEVAALQHSLGFERGVFSEALFLGKRGGGEGQWEGGVLVVGVSPLEHWLLTSHPPDQLTRQRMLEFCGGDLLQAAQQLAEGGMR